MEFSPAERGVWWIAAQERTWHCPHAGINYRGGYHGFQTCYWLNNWLGQAFNLFPRRLAAKLLQRLGISNEIVTFWMLNLSRLSHSLSVNGEQCCQVIPGSFFFNQKVKTPQLQPYAYADNWTWISFSTRDQFQAWVHVRNLIADLRMKISIPNSLIWGSGPKIRQECQHVNVLFHDLSEELQMQTHAKDLGEIVQYSRKQVWWSFRQTDPHCVDAFDTWAEV